VTVRILYFAVLRERLGHESETLDVPDGATVGVVRAMLAAAHPELAELLPRVATAVNRTLTTNAHRLADGDEVALIPPVSGGSTLGAVMPTASAKLRIATLTISDTRTSADDAGGHELRRLLEHAGFGLAAHEIISDGAVSVTAAVQRLCADTEVDAIVTTGGTGLAPRDQTYEAVDALLDRRLDGFGEAFRRLSWDDVGPRAILSRALAGTIGGKVIVALPGSPRALALAVEKILAPVLGHAVAVARGGGAHHA
jgi:molybdopterin adenylyltransferase